MTDLNRKTVVDAPIDLTKPQREDVYKELDEHGKVWVDHVIKKRDGVIKELGDAENKIDETIREQNIRRNRGDKGDLW